MNLGHTLGVVDFLMVRVGWCDSLETSNIGGTPSGSDIASTMADITRQRNCNWLLLRVLSPVSLLRRTAAARSLKSTCTF